MAELRPLMIEAARFDVAALRTEWQWLVPSTDIPLFISAFGDWVFGSPNGSLWVLSVLDGSYTQVARNAREYNTLNKSSEWIEQTFGAGWLPIAARQGLVPEEHQCLGWRVHPLLGGKFESANLQVFSMLVYQSVMGQLHQQHQQRQAPATR